MEFPQAKEDEKLALILEQIIFFIKQDNLGIDWAMTMSCRSFQGEVKLIS